MLQEVEINRVGNVKIFLLQRTYISVSYTDNQIMFLFLLFSDYSIGIYFRITVSECYIIYS